MDIYKIALLGIISAILIMALKDQVPVFTVVISIITGILIILYILPQIKEIVLEMPKGKVPLRCFIYSKTIF